MLGDMKAIHDMESKMFSKPASQTVTEKAVEPEKIVEPVKQAEPEPEPEPVPEPTVVQNEPAIEEPEEPEEKEEEEITEEGPGAPAEVIEQEVSNPTNITVEPGLE